ncbi:hypothetical protein ACWEO4_34380 [Streptomyces sp. NPDC004393]|uniref:hypothetical protein n=1 Tax=Streptomyces sp. NPDC004533 TaxID=3154278 RepID=UPI0033B8ECFE
MTEQARQLQERAGMPEDTAAPEQAEARIQAGTPQDATAAATPVGPSSADGPEPPKQRRVLRAVLRWTAAVVVFAAAGAGTAYGITRMERTDVPGLATESDGRWDYPLLSKPPLPSGSPGPFAEDNPAGAHYADLRALVLPAPEGASEDKALNGRDGWLATKDFLAEFAMKEDRTELGQSLTDLGLRHVAARGWTTQDGTRTRVYLLQFGTAEVAHRASEAFGGGNAPEHEVRGADVSHLDADFPSEAEVKGIWRVVYTEDKPYGDEQVRHAYLQAGDIVAMVVQSRRGTAPAVPFQQTVTLQSQLLG